MQLLTFTLASLSGFMWSHFATRNHTKLYRKIPVIKIKFLQITPSVMLHFKNRTLHLHHWLSYTIILIITLTYPSNLFDLAIFKGFLVGGILQGFTYHDWKKIVVKKDLGQLGS